MTAAPETPDQPVDLSIITVSTNESYWLETLLKSLFRLESRLRIEVIVVDNNSTDGTSAYVRENYPEAALVRQKKLHGFASNNNRGIARARGRYILLLNPDTRVREGVLDGMVQYMEEHANVGICSCRLLSPDGSTQNSCRRFPTLEAVIARWAERLIPGVADSWQKRYVMEDYDKSYPRPVDWVFGACLLLRREVLGTIGLLDIRFDPLYYEDVDLCARAWQAGYEVHYLPQFVVPHHYHRSSARSLLNRMAYYHIRNVFRFWRKHRTFLKNCAGGSPSERLVAGDARQLPTPNTKAAKNRHDSETRPAAPQQSLR